MENASKALIIAGAILLSILLISLGMMVYNQAAGIANSDQMNSVEVSTFNTKFTQYQGTKVTGANVNNLLENVCSSNRMNVEDGISIDVVGPFGNNYTQTTLASPASLSVFITKAQTGKIYTVVCDYDAVTGYINKVTVTANS